MIISVPSWWNWSQSCLLSSWHWTPDKRAPAGDVTTAGDNDALLVSERGNLSADKLTHAACYVRCHLFSITKRPHNTIFEPFKLKYGYNPCPASIIVLTGDCLQRQSWFVIRRQDKRVSTLCSGKKHPLTFSFIFPWMMCGFKQKLQWIYPRKGRFCQCRN